MATFQVPPAPVLPTEPLLRHAHLPETSTPHDLGNGHGYRLIIEDDVNDRSDSNGGEASQGSGKSGVGGWLSEIRRVAKLGIPLAGAELLQFSGTLIETAFIGRLGSLCLSAWILSRTFTHITGLSLVFGLASGLETFCGQAFGARNYAFLGVVLQRAWLIVLLVSSLSATLWTQAERILLLLGQDAAIASAASGYIIRWIPALYLNAVEGCLYYFYTAQGIVIPSVFFNGVCTALTPFYVWLFAFHLELGLHGAAYAECALAGTSVALQLAYLGLRTYLQEPSERTWRGWSPQALRGWTSYLRVALPATAMMCLDWWQFEIVIVISGLLPHPQITVAVMGLAFNIHAWCYMAVHGLAGATSTRVSNELGAGNHKAAQLATEVATALGTLLMGIICFVLLVFKEQVAHIFTEDEEVVAGLQDIMLPLATSLIGDGTSTILSGALRGSGRQLLGATLNLLVNWGFGLPLAAGLAFWAGYGVWGIWVAQLVVSVVLPLVFLACVLRFDWKQEAQKAAASDHGRAHMPH